jgi:hypothetical protein
MTCSSGCPTQDHRSYGECLRSKAPKIAFCNSAAGQDYTKQKRWDRELDAYQDAKRQGIQPEGTRLSQINEAVELSNTVGRAYRADTGAFN